ncbi:UNVERIFIED_CONTAM: Nuclear intron maturase 4, mitochondrial [Sesamum calycinum]|uniref:Nuclear intron maturase 4, mitochondrial n=1 Tax=Sesamum calycinum TaxID=2727403 RepID=A0AAW2N1H7_9LAMI
MSMQYETSKCCNAEEHTSNSKLRSWFRRQIDGNDVQQYNVGKNSGVRVHCCRFMDEIFFAISGPKEVALAFKSDIERYLKNSLYLDVESQGDILACSDARGVQFLGILIKRRLKENAAVRAVHKLKDKVKAFAEQKQESWDAGAARIGKKWLAHGLKKVKESEIKHLADSSSVLHQISCHRKSGMETDHWYKVLLKIWMQDVNAKSAESEEIILAKHITEPALPQELRDSYYEFKKRAKEYISSETASTLALLPGSSPTDSGYITEMIAPANII